MNSLKYDVVILGGGTSGCACAYNCSKLGLKTLLVEKNNFLGGLMTGGLVVPVMKSSVDDLNCEFYKSLVEILKKYKGCIKYKDGNDGWFNPELLKIALDDLLTLPAIQKNLDILFEVQLSDVLKSGKTISKIILKNGILSIPIVSNYYVDATGDGSFSHLAGCEFLNDYPAIQQNSLRFIVGNVNYDEFVDFLTNLEDNEDITNTYRDDIDTYGSYSFTTASTWDENKVWKLDKYLKNAVADGVLNESDRSYFQIFSIAGSNSQVAFNCPRIGNFKNNPFMSSNELVNARKAIYRLFNFVKTYFKGFENAEIVNIASITGTREQNRIKTKYIYTKEDIMNLKQFITPALRANYSIDVHSDKKNSSVLQKTPSYELPIESLMSADIVNLFVIGKLVGADFMAHSALRVQKSCMSMGEAVAKYIKK